MIGIQAYYILTCPKSQSRLQVEFSANSIRIVRLFSRKWELSEHLCGTEAIQESREEESITG